MGQQLNGDVFPIVRADPASGSLRILVQPPPPMLMALTLRPAHPLYDRVDQVEWKRSTGEIRVVTGTPGATVPPMAPDEWEPVTWIRVPRGAVLVTHDQVLPVTPGSEPPTAPGIYRTGRRNGRTLYVQDGPNPTDGDRSIGMLDTAELARFAVESMNAALAAAREAEA